MSESRAYQNRVPCESESNQSSSATTGRILLAVYSSVFCERFCFFLLISVLVLFLNERCGYSSVQAVRWYGVFVSNCYLTALLGGWLCDRIRSAGRVACLGIALQTIGFALLVAETPRFPLLILFVSSLGAGLFKAGTQTLLGSLSLQPASIRERAFAAVYVIVNIAGLAPLLGGTLQTWAGYRSLFALLVGIALIGSACLLPTLSHHYSDSVHPTMQPADNASTAPRTALALILSSGMLFAAAFVQSHSTLLLFLRDHTNRQLGRYTVPVAWFGAAPGAMVLLLAPGTALFFSALRKRSREPSTLYKLAIGMVITALALLPIWGAVHAARGGHLVSPVWVLSSISLLAIGELLVGALAPAEISRISPPGHTGRWMSYWFVATALGNVIGGWVEW